MERELFLRKYRIEQEDFDAAGVSWEELTAIADHYATIEGKLREIGKDFVDKYLYDIEIRPDFGRKAGTAARLHSPAPAT